MASELSCLFRELGASYETARGFWLVINGILVQVIGSQCQLGRLLHWLDGHMDGWHLASTITAGPVLIIPVPLVGLVVVIPALYSHLCMMHSPCAFESMKHAGCCCWSVAWSMRGAIERVDTHGTNANHHLMNA